MNEKQLTIGLGEAIKRLIKIETLRSTGFSNVPEQTKAEIEMITQALNTQTLNLGIYCNTDNVAGGIGIFEQSAATSCCRISRPDSPSAPKSTSRRFIRGG